MNKDSITRRQFLTIAGIATAGIVGACVPKQSTRSTPGSQKKRSLRIAHLTDIHVFPGSKAEDGMVRAIRHAQNQPDPPDLILNTGDSIMDSLEASKEYTETQWEIFNNIIQAECKKPAVHVIGNHDVWGWGLSDTQVQADPLYGKQMAIQQLKLSNRYSSFDRAGWHFIVLDSTHIPNKVSKHPYIGKIDDEQLHWLVNDVQEVTDTTPICILSHIPILCACEFFDGPNEESGNWLVPAAWMHIDARVFREIFLKHPNIRLCLSGHAHQYESLDYLGVRYITSGAVCGNWWDGAYLDFPPAYVLVDLFDDGTAESTFVTY